MKNFKKIFIEKIKKKFLQTQNINQLLYEKSKLLGKNGIITIQIKNLSKLTKEKKKKKELN